MLTSVVNGNLDAAGVRVLSCQNRSRKALHVSLHSTGSAPLVAQVETSGDGSSYTPAVADGYEAVAALTGNTKNIIVVSSDATGNFTLSDGSTNTGNILTTAGDLSTAIQSAADLAFGTDNVRAELTTTPGGDKVVLLEWIGAYAGTDVAATINTTGVTVGTVTIANALTSLTVRAAVPATRRHTVAQGSARPLVFSGSNLIGPLVRVTCISGACYVDIKRVD